MEDSVLVSAFQSGDESAFDELVRRYRRQVYRIARGVLHRHEQADEAAQETFVKVYHGLAGFQGGSSFRTWLHRIAVHAALDLKDRERTQRNAREQAEREALADRGTNPESDVLDGMERDERLVRLRRAVARLPERQRTTLLLHVHEGLKYTEIAETLGCPVGTAKANFHHAVQGLRKMLGVENDPAQAGPAHARQAPPSFPGAAEELA